jgi:hypothetical protein
MRDGDRMPDDPMEITNLAAANPGIGKRISETMLAWHKTPPAGLMDPTAGESRLFAAHSCIDPRNRLFFWKPVPPISLVC